MPVRFRCKYCNQLLGIARRKIGTEVRCPECQKMVLVPGEDAADVDDEPTRKRDFMFEGAVDPRLQSSVGGPAGDPPKAAGSPTAAPAALESIDAELYRLPVPRPGVFLSAWHAMLLFLAALLILVLAFAVGLLVGRYVL